MQTFKSFSEEKAVKLTGGGKTVTLKPGQSVSFKHHATGKTVTGTFKKKKMMGGRQYAHVDMGNEGMYVPVHHINESVNELDVESEQVDEGKYNWDKAHRGDMHNTLGNRMLYKKSYRPVGQKSKAELRKEIEVALSKNIQHKMKSEEVEQVEEGIKEKIGGMIRRSKQKDSWAQSRRDVALNKAGDSYAAGKPRNAAHYLAYAERDRKKHNDPSSNPTGKYRIKVSDYD